MTENRSAKNKIPKENPASGKFQPGNSQRLNASPENLKKHRATPKQSNQPKTVSRSLKKLLQQKIKEADPLYEKLCKDGKRHTWGDIVARRVLEHLLVKGNPSMLAEILDRTEGKVAQKVDVAQETKTRLVFEIAPPPEGWTGELPQVDEDDETLAGPAETPAALPEGDE